jgi:hypothetical protein
MLTCDDCLIFVHVPKTAGTSITACLDYHFPNEAIYPGWTFARMPYDMAEIRAALAGKRLIRGHFYRGVSRFVDKNPVWMTILRDPVERVLSLYSYMHTQEWSHPAYRYPLERFITGDMPYDLRGDTENGMCKFLAADWINEQYTSPQALSRAIDFIDRCAMVGITERLDESRDLMAATFGWERLKRVVRENVSTQRIQRNEVDPALIDIIRRNNAQDYALYDYAMAQFERDLAAAR